MKSFCTMVLVSFVLFGCNEAYKGQLSFDLNATLISDRNKDVELAAGQYEAQLKLKNKSEIELSLKAANKKHRFLFSLPENFKLPREKGTFELTSEQTGQPLYLFGNLDSVVTESREQQNFETCSFDTYIEYCAVDRAGYRNCYCRPGTRHDGEQLARYYYVYTDRTITVDIESADQALSVGQFDGTYRFSEKIYTYKSLCRPRYYDRCTR